MKTLPANWSTYINGSFDVVYLLEISTLDGSTIRLGTVDSNAIPGWTGDRFYGGRIAENGLGVVSMSANIDAGGGIASLSDLNITLLNQDDYWSNTLSALYLHGSPVEVRRFMLEAAPTEFSDGLVVFGGQVTKATHDRYYIELTLSADESEHNSLPRRQISEKEFASGAYDIPDNSQGKPIPIQFGENDLAELVFCNAKTTIEDGPSVATGGSETTLEDSAQSWSANQWADKDVEIIGGTGKGLINVVKSNTADTLVIYDTFQTNPAANGSVYRISDTQFDMIISDELIKEWNRIDNLYQIFWWDDQAKLMISFNPLVASISTFPKSGMSGFRFLAGVVKKNEITFYYPYPFTSLVDAGEMSNPNNAIDFDNSTFATKAADGLNFPGCKGKFETDLNNLIGSWTDIFVFSVMKHSDTGVTSLYEIESFDASGSQLGNNDVLTVPFSELFNNLPRNVYTPPTGFPAGATAVLVSVGGEIDPGDWGSLNFNREFRITFKSAGGTPYDIFIYDAGVCFSKTIALNERSRFFASIKGRTFGDNWESRKTSTDLVQNPADVIEKILRTDLGVSGTDIDTSEFDQVSGTDRSGWELAYSIMNEINSLDEIDKICQEAFCIYYKRHNGRHSIRALGDNSTTDKYLTVDDIKRDENGQSTLRYEYSPLIQVYNEFIVHFKKHPVTGDYEGNLFVTDPDQSSFDASYSNLSSIPDIYWDYCHASYQRYGFKRTKHIYLDRVRNSVTAEKILKRAVLWFYVQKQIAALDTQLQNCDLELGDNITLSSPLTGSLYFLYNISEDLNNDVISLNMREI